jgi:hypothetical protein
MTKRAVDVSSGNWFEGSQVSKARPGAPFDFSLTVAERVGVKGNRLQLENVSELDAAVEQ